MIKRKELSSGYLTKDQVEDIASECATLLVESSIISREEVLLEGEEEKLRSALVQVLLSDSISTALLRPNMWDGVFWHPPWERPDQVAEVLNMLLKEGSNDTFVLVSSLPVRWRRSLSGGSAELREALQLMFMALGYLPATAGVQTGRLARSVTKTEVFRFLLENHQMVTWKNGSFVVKATDVYKVDLHDYAANSTLVTVNLGVKKWVAF